MKIRFGYRKLTKEEAATGAFGPPGLRIARIDEATPIFDEMRQRVDEGAGPQEIVDWLEATGIKPGPYVTTGHWSYTTVVSLVNDPILSGTRTFRDVIHRPIYKTGRHRRIKNAKPEQKYVPELAHMTVEQQQELITKLEANGRHVHNPQRGAANPRYRKPRGMAIFPAQHAECTVCQRRMHRTLKDQVQCVGASRSSAQRCWSHVLVQCEPARGKIFAWLLHELEEFPRHREALLEVAWSHYQKELACRRQNLEEIGERIRTIEKESDNLVAAIAVGGQLKALVKQMKLNEAKLAKCRKEEKEEVRLLREELTVVSREEFFGCPLAGMLAVARRTSSFAVFLHQLFPRFEIIPVQSLDHKLVRPRGRIVLRLGHLVPSMEPPAEITANIDLFDPPLHIEHLQACVAEQATHPELNPKQIGVNLQIGHMTVRRAFAYFRLMQNLHMTDPYLVLKERPEHAARWKERPRKAS